MAAERKREGGSWGFRFSQAGRCYKQYGYQSREEAKEAEAVFRADLKTNPPLQPTALGNVVSAYLSDSAEDDRSQNRLDSLSYSMRKHIVPYFGSAKVIGEITPDEVRAFCRELKKTRLKASSRWIVVSNLRAVLNYSVQKKLIRKNPINRIDTPNLRASVGATRTLKPPMDLSAVDRAASAIRHPLDRAWFDTCRYTGMRKDECNRLRWDDVDFDRSMIHVPGSKTPGSDAWLPLAPIARETLKELRAVSDPDCALVFPGRAHHTKGKKVYDRSSIFTQIEKETGIHLKPKDLRDYFATQVSNQVKDPAVIMKLMRHTSLETTSRYLRTDENRMRDAVRLLGRDAGGNLGGNLKGAIGREKTQLDMPPDVIRLAQYLLSHGFSKGDSATIKADGKLPLVFHRNVQLPCPAPPARGSL
jgi:integrase/recombinase XerD